MILLILFLLAVYFYYSFEELLIALAETMLPLKGISKWF